MDLSQLLCQQTDAQITATRLDMLLSGVNLIDQGFTLFDESLCLVAGNRRFAELLDFPETLMQVGTPFESFMRHNAERGEYGSGDVDQLVADRMQTARQFLPHIAERIRPDGTIVAIHGQPLPQGGFVTLYTDITAQRHAEFLIQNRNALLEQHVAARTAELEAANARLHENVAQNHAIAAGLRRSELQLRLITDAIPACIAYIDSGHIVRFANLGFADWYGKSTGTLVGQHIADVMGDVEWQHTGDFLSHALVGMPVSYEYTDRTPDHITAKTNPSYGDVFADAASERHRRTEMVPEYDVDGQVVGVFVLATDITAQRRTQATLMQAQKREAVGQLAGGIAHDLNNMLTVVLGNLASLEELLVQRDDAVALRTLVEPALLATRRSASLIRRLLEFSRQPSPSPEAVIVAKVIAGVDTLLRRSLSEDVILTLTTDDAMAAAIIDPNQLENALINLVLNARDAMPDGGHLSLDTTVRSVDAAAAEYQAITPGRYVQVSVTDNGIGMDVATLRRACEPFFSTKVTGAGSGLGLAMVAGFARQSGGCFTLESSPMRGTRASLFLPVAAGIPVAQQIPSVAATPLVLLVDDDTDVRQVIRRQLIELGYAVVEATDGSEALQLLEQIGEITALITDIVMPGEIDGAGLADLANRLRPEMPILFVSGNARGSNRAARFPLLDKPFTREQLLRALVTARQ